MSMVWPYLVFALGLGAVFGGERGASWINTAGWLLLAGGFAFLMWSDSTLGAALSVAAIAGFAALPSAAEDQRKRVAQFGAIVPTALALCAVICVRDVSSIWGGNIVLFAAAWAALAAALSSFVAAMGTAKRPLSGSVALTIAGAAIATLIAGSGRSSLPEAFYGFSLRTGDEPLQWILGPVPGFESGIRLSVAVPVPALEAGLISLAVIALVGAAGAVLQRRKLASVPMMLCGLGGLGAVVGLQPLVSSLTMPAADMYANEVKRRLLARGGEQVTSTGGFTSSGDITVAMADVAPEIFGLAMIAFLGIWGFFAIRSHPEDAPVLDRKLGRDLVARGVAFLWVGWFVLLIIHNELLGAPGMGSPGEWVFTGVCITSTGAALMAWSPPSTRLGEVFDELTPGLLATGLLICTGLAWRFGALPGLSLGIFE